MRRWRAFGCAVMGICSVLCGCTVGTRAVSLPVVHPGPGDEAIVAVCSGAMPSPLSDVARHGWFAVHERGGDGWTRWEVWGDVGERHAPPLQDLHGAGAVRVHGIVRGAAAESIIACIKKETQPWGEANPYRVWPGPNSNTYVDEISRRCGAKFDLPATAIGKDWRGIVGASWTAGGTGFQVESPLVGLKLGLTEGIEIHFLGFAFGIDLWPPAIILPVGVGRLGFDDR